MLSPVEAMLWAGALLLWIAAALVLWVFFEFVADALKVRRAKRGDLRSIEGGDDDA